MTADWPIRRLTLDDLPHCRALAADRGWTPSDRRWAMLFDVGDLYGIEAPGGGLAVTGALTRHGNELAGIGMLVTAERFGRRGLGRRLMEHLLTQAAGATVFLYATPQGRPLYEKLGFRQIGTVTTYIGEFRSETKQSLRGGCDLKAVDVEAYGADRTPALRWLAANARRFLTTDGGYGAAWSNLGGLVVGPVIAPNLAAATSLVSALTENWDGRIRIDVDHQHPGLAEWVAARGPKPMYDSPLMVHSGQWPGRRDLIYAPMNQAVG